MTTKREEIERQLEEVKASHPTEHDAHDPYWRGVRIGLETAIAIMDDPDFRWFANSRERRDH